MSISIPPETLVSVMSQLYPPGKLPWSKSPTIKDIENLAKLILKKLSLALPSDPFIPLKPYEQHGVKFYITEETVIVIDPSFSKAGTFKIVKRAIQTKENRCREIALLFIKNPQPHDRQEIRILKALHGKLWASQLLASYAKEGQDGYLSNIILIQPFYGKENLLEFMERNLNQSQCHYILYQVLVILARLHEMRLVHRDIKASNFLVSEERRLIITDFSSACEIKTPGEILFCGTPIAMAPEYAAHKDQKDAIGEFTTTALDIWALGVLCARLFRHKVLLSYVSRPDVKTLYAHLSNLFVTQELPPTQTDPLGQLFASMLHPVPERRRTANELLGTFLPYLADYHNTLLKEHDRDANLPPSLPYTAPSSPERKYVLPLPGTPCVSPPFRRPAEFDLEEMQARE